MAQRDVFEIERERKAMALKQEADTLEALEDAQAVLETQEGRRFLYKLLADCGVWRSSFHTNALAMAFNEGQRNIGLLLQARLLKASPGRFQTMLEEHSGDRSKQP